jgi:arginyl-tRNA--protein-N-Asp/Glu arginylyltransferase
MRIATTEAATEYAKYIHGYQVWGLPDDKERPSMFLEMGFAPARPDLSLYYLSRQVRVPLRDFSPSSENRRVMRKCASIEYQLIPRGEFDYTSWWRNFCKTYTDTRIGPNAITHERLDSWFSPQLTTHVMRFADTSTGRPVGLATLYVEDKTLAFYSRSFYDLDYFHQNLGMYQMIASTSTFAEQGIKHMYLGTCYSRSALYKIQFKGTEFFNGFRWTDNMRELKYLIQRDQDEARENLFYSEEFHQKFYASHTYLFDAAEMSWSIS